MEIKQSASDHGRLVSNKYDFVKVAGEREGGMDSHFSCSTLESIYRVLCVYPMQNRKHFRLGARPPARIQLTADREMCGERDKCANFQLGPIDW